MRRATHADLAFEAARVAAALVAKDREIERLRSELADMMRTAFYFANSMPLVTARYAAHRAEYERLRKSAQR